MSNVFDNSCEPAASAELDVGLTSDENTMTGDTTINMLLDAFQECKQRGDWATLFLETKNGEDFGTLKVKLSGPRTRRTPGQTSFGSSPKKKTPLTLRRDRARLEKFMKERRIQETWVPKKISTPSAKSQAMDFPA